MRANIKFFKSFQSIFCILSIITFIFCSFCFSFEESDSNHNKDEENQLEQIKVRVDYTEIPNQASFFKNTKFEKYREIGETRDLTGIWTGTYNLKKSSVFWTRSNLESINILKSIDFRPYNVYLRFGSKDFERYPEMEISQEGVDYSSVNIKFANNKQINYWAKATSKNWLEVIRGKIMRLNENELFTEFQTTVYDGKIPIYAFRGEVVLTKNEDQDNPL